MSLFNTHDLLAEAARAQIITADNFDQDEIETGFEGMWADLPELNQPLEYTAEAVSVFGIPNGDEKAIVVEYDNLAKFMEFNNIDNVVEALDSLKEYYNLDDIGIVVESYDSAVVVMEEAKKLNQKAAEKSGLAKVKSSTDLLRDLKTKGVKVWKRSSKKTGK